MAAPAPRLSEDAALSLAVAVVEASPGPLILLDDDLIVIGASRSFCKAFDVDPATVRGAALTELGAGEWREPPLQALLAASRSGASAARVCDLSLRRPGLADRQLVIHAERLEYFDLEHARIMVAIFDVTQARAQELAIAEAEAHISFCFGKSDTASRTACKSSLACSSRTRARPSPRRRRRASPTPTTGSCRSPPSNANSPAWATGAWR